MQDLDDKGPAMIWVMMILIIYLMGKWLWHYVLHDASPPDVSVAGWKKETKCNIYIF